MVIFMTEIRYVQPDDKEFWYSLDRHLPEPEFMEKVNTARGYVLLDGFCAMAFSGTIHRSAICSSSRRLIKTKDTVGG